jgi:tryptophan synthase beta subunit
MSKTVTYQQPNEFGYYGKFGGAYIPEMLIAMWKNSRADIWK